MKSALCGAVAALVLLACKTPPKPIEPVVLHAPASMVNTIDPLFEDIERRTFDFFWETAEPETGLVPDRWPKPPFSSIAAIGFALNAYAIGAERRYVTRAQARERVLLTLKFLHGLPQGPESASTAGYQGFFYHFLNFGTGLRYGNSELSTVDTALLMAGVLFVAGYFDGDDPAEKPRSARWRRPCTNASTGPGPSNTCPTSAWPGVPSSSSRHTTGVATTRA